LWRILVSSWGSYRLAAAALLAAPGIGASLNCGTACETRSIASVPSPGRELEAVALVRSSRSPSETTLEASVLPPSAAPGARGNLFTSDPFPSSRLSLDSIDLPLSLNWEERNRLVVEYDPWLRIASSRESVASVRVMYRERTAPQGGSAMTLHLTSTAFDSGGSIPALYTCEGKNLAPPLAWSGTPEGTKSLALIADDPDAPDPAAPKRTWVHWVVYNLPPADGSLQEGARDADLPKGALPGLNDWGRTGYGGPCPPIGRHRYFFKLYALDVVLPDLHQPKKAALEAAMEGHVIGKVELFGTYQKTGKH
jgi:hypothetical protein